MRTTLTIDSDVLSAARDLAKYQKSTVGQIISDLARSALTDMRKAQPSTASDVYGICPLPKRGVVVSNDLVNAIREEEGV